jgi:hypothetical protein
MDVAPAGTEAAVVMGAVVQGGCVQQYAAVVAWVWQRAACVGRAAGSGGRGTIAMDGRQPACMRQLQRMWCACKSMQRSGMCVATCSGSSVCVAAGESSQQHNCNETVLAAGRGGGAKSSS